MKSHRTQLVRPRRKIEGKYEYLKKNSANQPPDSEQAIRSTRNFQTLVEKFEQMRTEQKQLLMTPNGLRHAKLAQRRMSNWYNVQG